MSDRCCVNPGAKQIYTAQGHETTTAELSIYTTGRGTSAIVIFTDVFGSSFINTRKLADQFAEATGTTVIIPDLFDGDALDPDASDLYEKLPAWLDKHPVEPPCAAADRLIAAIKDSYESIQVIVRRDVDLLLYVLFHVFIAVGDRLLLWC
jgi:dienelactone hydrolase